MIRICFHRSLCFIFLAAFFLPIKASSAFCFPQHELRSFLNSRLYSTAQVQNDSAIQDTTAMLTGRVWIFKKRGQKEALYLSEDRYMPDGRYKIVSHKTSPAKVLSGTWRRKGKMLYCEMDGFPGDHTFEILTITDKKLVLHFQDKDVVEEYRSKE